MVGGWNAIRMRRDLPVENIDLPARTGLSQMIEGAPIAEAELQDDTRQRFNPTRCVAQACALRLQSADEAVEAAHAATAPRKCGTFTCAPPPLRAIGRSCVRCAGRGRA